MTEQEWLECGDPTPMLASLRGKASKRKVRLFAVACCKRPYFRVADERHRMALELAERMADEEVDEVEWQAVHKAALELWQGALAASLAAQQEVEALVHADQATEQGWLVLEFAWMAAERVTYPVWDKDHADEPDHQLILLRDIFGNPFRPAAVDPSWLTATVVGLARAAYDERTMPAGTLESDRLAVLADALEDAGCSDAAILGHLRGPGVHTRGCWVLDLVLEKE